jgi:RNA polymerase sigma-70 factor, ECF subfamily
MSTAEPESALVQRACRGDKGAFGELVQRYRRPVLAIAYRMTGDAATADDLAQSAFIQAWLRLGTLRAPAAFKGWLFRLTVNACLDHLRREPASAALPEERPDGQPGPEATAVAREREQAVRQAVLALPPHCRAALVLREFEGLSYQETATALGIPLGTVMSRLSYARSLLRGALAEQLRSVGAQEE